MAPAAGDLKTAIVLLAEDNPAEQRLAQRALARGKIACDLRIVSDGEEAMDYLLRRNRYLDPEQAPRPDLILLDLNMPKLDGRQVLQQMKSNPQLAIIPVVVLTTSQQEQDVLHSYRLGCNSFIRKPVDVHAFIDTMISLGFYWFHLVIMPPRKGE